MPKKAGFTLIELLIVIAIIALLMAILMPGLNLAKEQGRIAVCRANLKQWSLIANIYAEQNNGLFWSGAYKPVNPSWVGFWWIAQLDKNTQSWKNNKIWFCPNAKKPRYNENGNPVGENIIFGAWGIDSKAYNDSIWNSTGANLPLCNEDGIAGSYGINGYCLGTAGKVENWKGPNVKGPTNNIPLFLDAIRYDGWPRETENAASNPLASWEESGVSDMARFCIDRHRRYTGCVFLDSSARKVGLKELWTLKWSRTFATNGKWTRAGHVDRSAWPEWIKGYPDY